MARPTLITVKGTYLKLDGTPESGTIQFFSTVQAMKSGDRFAVVPSEIKIQLDNTGSFEVVLPASNDPAWLPVGWTYKVVLRLSNDFSTFHTVVPYNAINGEVFITALLPAQPGGSALYAASNHTHGSQYAFAVHTHEASDIVSGTIALARLPVGVAPGTIATGDHTHNFDNVWAAVNHTHDAAYAPINHNHDSVYATINHTHNYADLIGNPVVNVDKAAIGLDNVDNTHDVDKPVSTATQSALALKAPLASPTFTGTVSGVTKSMVGLGNVDNISDANKPVSSATQTALNLKANLASPTFTGTVSGISKAMVGLGNVDNTADSAKPISTAQQTALDGKAAVSHTHTIANITNLQSTLDNKQASGSYATTTDVTNLGSRVTAVEDMTPVVMVWSGSAYVESNSARVYVGPNDPGSVSDGSVWIDTTP